MLSFRLGNADFAVTRQLWSVDKLKLDATNPRLGYILRAAKKGPTTSDKELQKILWEANRCYDAACYNACAAMMRRLVENLIVEAFERHRLADRIR